MSTAIQHIFVYGSLRSGFKNPAYEYLSKYFIIVGNGLVQGKLFDAGTFPVAVNTTENNFLVGELYVCKNIQELDWALAQLDDYEGVTVEQGETPMYKREVAKVLYNNTETKAWIYWYNGNVSNYSPIASADMMEYKKK